MVVVALGAGGRVFLLILSFTIISMLEPILMISMSGEMTKSH